jgi:hypothetical protein
LEQQLKTKFKHVKNSFLHDEVWKKNKQNIFFNISIIKAILTFNILFLRKVEKEALKMFLTLNLY